MSELEAIRAATIEAATLLNWRDEKQQLLVGDITPGSFADIIALGSDPLEDIRRLESIPVVIKGGKLVLGEQE